MTKKTPNAYKHVIHNFMCMFINYNLICRDLTYRINDRQYTYNVTMRRFREIIVAVESSKYYILCVSLALVIQNVKRMRRIVICGFSVSIIFFYFISQTA